MLDWVQPLLGFTSASLVALIALFFGVMMLFFSGSAVLVLGQFLLLLPGAFEAPAAVSAEFGTYRQVGTVLFTDYVLAFEATSLLLLAAMVGAVILAKRKID